MGRISMPIMNKTGHSMFWNSMWDDKLNYTRNLKEDMFIKAFFNVFFEGGNAFMVKVSYTRLEHRLSYLKKKYKFQIKKIIKKSVQKEFTRNKTIKIKKRKFLPYLSKVWILKYQSWVVIFLNSYIFDFSVFFKRKKKNYKLKKYFYILLSYYNSLMKNYINYKFYKNSIIKKYSF